MKQPASTTDLLQLARAVRAACIEAARAGYETAATDGLCQEGAWEAAIGAMQQLDLSPLLEAIPTASTDGSTLTQPRR